MSNKAEHADTGREPRVAVEGHYDAVVVGAGFSGLYALHRLREQGLRVIGIEAGTDVGGTWYWNRYPGARCDVPSLNYSYTWSPELRRDWRWSEKYAAQPEILRYVQHVAERFSLRELIKFQTRVQSATFDDQTGSWLVITDRGDRIQSQFCLLATGNLSVPNVPVVQGIETFKGPVYHTGRWPKEKVDFTGLRVGVIGTGSSAVQAIPLIASEARTLTVFQRTPNFSVPARNQRLSEEDHVKFNESLHEFIAGLDSFGRVSPDAHSAPIPTREAQRQRYEELWALGGGGFLYAFPNILTNQEVNDCAAEFIREKIRQAVDDPETAKALCKMTSPLGVKRICIDTNYFQTFNRKNVELVNLQDEPLSTITPQGAKTAGREFSFDALVLATGFDAMTGAILAMDIKGRGGVPLRQKWSEGPKSYLGLMVAEFPNLFTITGPGSPSVIGNVLLHGEHHVEFISELISHMRDKDRRTVDVDGEAQENWMAHVAEVAEKTLFPKANSWYLGANIPGKPRVFMPYVGDSYRKTCARIVADGYRGFEIS